MTLKHLSQNYIGLGSSVVRDEYHINPNHSDIRSIRLAQTQTFPITETPHYDNF